MRPHTDNFTIRVLLILERATGEARTRPVTKSMELRLALAYLHLVSGQDRGIFDRFWQSAVKSYNQATEYTENYCRIMAVSGCMNGICELFGIDRKQVQELAKGTPHVETVAERAADAP